MKKAKLVVLDLPAVLSYDQLAMRQCLTDCIEEVMDCTPTYEGVDWRHNCSGIVQQIWQAELERAPSAEEEQTLRESFLKCLKKYFLDNEESFDVWPGVQNLLKSIDKKKNWDYVIVSDFWKEDTRFMLDSCGVFSAKLNIIAANKPRSTGRLLHKYLKKRGLSDDDRVYLVTERLRRKDVESHDPDRYQLIRRKPPHKKKSGEVEYPRFAKFF